MHYEQDDQIVAVQSVKFDMAVSRLFPLTAMSIMGVVATLMAFESVSQN